MRPPCGCPPRLATLQPGNLHQQPDCARRHHAPTAECLGPTVGISRPHVMANTGKAHVTPQENVPACMLNPAGAQRRPPEHTLRKITHHVLANCSLHNLRQPLTGIPVHIGSGNPNMAGQDLLSDRVACSPAVQVAAIVGEALDQGMDSTALAVQSSAPTAADDANPA